MEKDETNVIHLRDCFAAGYTIPQYCIDNGIKKPLFVSEEKFLSFVWEIYVQFKFDKRMTATYSFVDLPAGRVRLAEKSTYAFMTYENFSEINLADFDKILLLTSKTIDVPNKLIPFDTFTWEFLQRVYAEIPTLNFLQRYPKVKLFLIKYPLINRYKGGIKFHQTLKSLGDMKTLLSEGVKGKSVETPFDRFGYTNRQALQLLMGTAVKTNLDGSTTMTDNTNPLVNIKNGKRVTTHQPERYLNKIYMCGTCHDYGLGAPFDKTISSYLQQMLNENNLPYRVENESQRYACRYQDIFYNLNNMNPMPGDIIFLNDRSYMPKTIPTFDLSDAFDPPHDFKDAFCTKGHYTEFGYKLLAEKYFKFLTENNFFRDVEFTYPLPPPFIIAMEFPRSSNRAA